MRASRGGDIVDAAQDQAAVELGAPGPAARPRRWRPLAVASAMLVAVVGLAVAAGPSGEAGPDQAADRDAGEFPTPIDLGGPRDGKQSIALPVRVEPATGLIDGQEVTVTGTGFPAGASVGAVMCTREAGRGHGSRGVEACNIIHYAQATADATGVAVATFAVRRLVVLDGQEVDCASEAGRCLVAMGMISDYDTSGAAAVDFDPAVPLPAPPTVTLERTTGLADGEVVELRATGLVPGATLSWEVCSHDSRCGGSGFTQATADDGGRLRTDIRLWRQVGVRGPGSEGTLDCAVDPCRLHLHGEAAGGRALPALDIAFDPARGGREQPTATLLAEGPFAAGEEVPIRVDGLPAGAIVDAMVCHPGGGECAGAGSGASEGGTAVITLLVPATGPQWPGACERCPVTFDTYPSEDPGNLPPMLNADPLWVTIAG